MRWIVGMIGGAAVAAAMGGCGSPMLHSAAAPGTAVADPDLIGEWASSEPLQVRAVIVPPAPGAPANASSASLTVHDKGEFRTALTIELALTEIRGVRFADLFLARPERDKLVGAYGFLVVPVHQVVKVERDGDTLTVRQFRGDWLETHADGPAYAHDRVAVGGGEVVMITAETARLRDLLAAHADDPAAFSEPIVFRRVRN